MNVTLKTPNEHTLGTTNKYHSQDNKQTSHSRQEPNFTLKIVLAAGPWQGRYCPAASVGSHRVREHQRLLAGGHRGDDDDDHDDDDYDDD